MRFQLNLPSTALAAVALLATAAADAERIAPLPALAYGTLIVAACAGCSLTVTRKLISWFEGSRRPTESAPPVSRYNPRRWSNFAGILLLVWAFVAAEQLGVEWLTQPKATPVQLTRTECSNHRAADKNGNWCFYLSGPETNPLAERYLFRLPPTAFTPTPSIGSIANGWLLSYTSPVFGAAAYSKVTSQNH